MRSVRFAFGAFVSQRVSFGNLLDETYADEMLANPVPISQFTRGKCALITYHLHIHVLDEMIVSSLLCENAENP